MTETCRICGATFTPTPMHPMVTSVHCRECWPTVLERLAIVGAPRGPAMRAENV